jgi:hypothetical protein
MTRLLILLCLLAAGLVGAEWWLWPQQGPLPSLVETSGEGAAADPEGSPTMAGDGLPMPPLEHYQVIRERPLFIEGRRPLPDEPQGAPEESPPPPPPNKTPPPRIAISGILITPQDRYVLLRNPAKDGPSRLRKGDDFQGWVVESIQRDGFTLRQGGETHEVPLWDYQQVPLPVLPPAGAAPPPQPQPQPQPHPAAAVPIPAAPPGRVDGRDPRVRRPPSSPAAPPTK